MAAPPRSIVLWREEGLVFAYLFFVDSINNWKHFEYFRSANTELLQATIMFFSGFVMHFTGAPKPQHHYKQGNCTATTVNAMHTVVRMMMDVLSITPSSPPVHGVVQHYINYPICSTTLKISADARSRGQEKDGRRRIFLLASRCFGCCCCAVVMVVQCADRGTIGARARRTTQFSSSWIFTLWKTLAHCRHRPHHHHHHRTR